MNSIYAGLSSAHSHVSLRMAARWLIVIALLVFSPIAFTQGNLTNTAAQANALYEQGDYVGAINLYESLIAAGVHDSTIYFNLGNAYFQTQNLGKALLNYRRAQFLTPRDGDLNMNLARVRAERVDIQGDETMIFDSLASLTSGVLTVSELGWMTLIFWALFFGVLLALIARVDWREILRVPLIGAVILMMSALLMLGSRLFVESSRPAGVVLNDVAVMSGPGDDYLEIYRLYSAAELRILEQRGDWVRFILPDQRQGWIQSSMVEII